MKKFLFYSAAIGAMTAAERSKGRYMRAPEHPVDQGEADFAEFEKAGNVEVGKKDDIETNLPDDEKPAKPAKRAPGAPKAAPAAKPTTEKPAAADPEGDDDPEGDEDEGDEDETPRKPQKASERIRELSKRLRQSERLRVQDADRLTVLEKRLLSGNGGGDTSSTGNTAAPDPSDNAKYPLGHLDDRYIEDKLDWLAEQKASQRADAVLQRQQENEQSQAAERQRAELLDKVDDLSTRGSEVYDDFQEAVVEAGMRGDWRLSQPTFEAASEAENGVDILYALSQDKKEAKRVAELSSYGQLKYVAEKDAELSAKKQGRRIPRAGEPPSQTPRGANSRTRINPGTDNLNDFEKAWEADAKGK